MIPAITFRRIEMLSSLPKEEVLSALRQNTQPWVSVLSKHVGSGGNCLYGGHSAAKTFEGEVKEDGFDLQRIRYRAQSGGPRIWSRGRVETADGGTRIEVAYQSRTLGVLSTLFWVAACLGMMAFTLNLAPEQGMDPRSRTILLATVGIMLGGLFFIGYGHLGESRQCTRVFRKILQTPAPAFHPTSNTAAAGRTSQQ